MQFKMCSFNVTNDSIFFVENLCLCQSVYEIGQGVNSIDIVAGLEMINKFEVAVAIFFGNIFSPFQY